MLNFMPTGTENTYVALPPTSANHPSASPPLGPQSPEAAAVTAPKWKPTFSRTREIIDSNAGLLLIAASQVFMSLINVSVKMLHSIDPPISTAQLIIVRMGITYACCLMYMLPAGIPDPLLGPKGVRMLLASRGFFGFFGIFGIYYSLQYLSLSDATVLTFLAPLCTAIAGSLLLKEKFTAREALAGIFSLLGVILIARPAFIFGTNCPEGSRFIFGTQSQAGTLSGVVVNVANESDSSQRLVAVGVALVGVLGATSTFPSALSGSGPMPSTLFHHILCSVSLCLLFSKRNSHMCMVATKSPFIIPTRLDWLGLLMLIGIFGFIAQLLLTMGLQRETASRGTLALYTQVISATILERIFFKSTPSMLSVCGTLIILTSALYVILTKQTDSNALVLRQPDEQTLEEGLLDDGEFAPGESPPDAKHPTTCSPTDLHIRT